MEQYKICHDIRPNSTKTMGTKLKGLSIRSNSDMNVSQSTHPATVKKDMYNKEQDFSKLKITQVDTNGCHISPTSEKVSIFFLLHLRTEDIDKVILLLFSIILEMFF